jgi:hypothetical protein
MNLPQSGTFLMAKGLRIPTMRGVAGEFNMISGAAKNFVGGNQQRRKVGFLREMRWFSCVLSSGSFPGVARFYRWTWRWFGNLRGFLLCECV